MSSLVDDLYQEVVVEHKRAPRHFGTLEAATHEARGRNPQCGDDVEVQLKLDDQLPFIDADSVRLRQLLHNLLKNAVEAMSSRDGAAVTVCTRYLGHREPPVVELEVADNGPGFRQEVLEHAFEPYVTTKTKGTGLGLAIVRKLVEEHGGTLEAVNRAEGGAAITICLPVSARMPLAIAPERRTSA